MDTWIKSKADQFAQAAHQHVSAVHQSASKLAEGVLDSVGGAPDDFRKDLEFREGPLGFTLEGDLVVAVAADSQAAQLGVEIGDRLVKVDGYEVPSYESGFEEQRARALIAKWLKEMPRPGILTFELPESDVEDGIPESPRNDADSQTDASGAAKAGAGVLQAELQRVQEQRKKLAAELQESQERGAALQAELEAARKDLAPTARRAQELEEQLQCAKAQNKELLAAVNVGSAEELTRLQRALADAEEAARARTSAAERLQTQQAQEVKSLAARLWEAEAALAASRQQVEPLEQELQGFRQAHEVELELLQKEQERLQEQKQQELQELQGQLEEQRLKAEVEMQTMREELQRSQDLLAEAQVNAAAAAVEARAARLAPPAEAPVAVPAAGEELEDEELRPLDNFAEVADLRKRINLLETRCASLQRRLRSEALGSGPRPSSRPGWELKVAAAAGPRCAALAVAVHGVALGSLRGFTERLLKSEAWLWVFFAHLVVLYTIAGSCSFSSASLDAGRGAVDSLNAQLAAKAAGATGAQSLRGA
ncbi:unnamed protein product [Effrenium voratum]|uniref:PDZ domain-containing protein n=1 Tax=Effrenium voratum TaxID=2562239 RepID=A0AA36MUQ6_9DINO|nr:unnamed protein product [Effrenium voratum]CAJ1445514.1 unnamed protein product [Effrenium voratum]